jgi:hypothetical protein
VTQFNPKSFNPIAPATNLNANGTGITIASSGNTIGGTSPLARNVIQGNTGAGVMLSGAAGTGNTVESNFILDNGADGVLVESASNHIGQAIGLGPSGAGNVISGNRGNGVHLFGPLAQANTVANNEIGTQVGLATIALAIRGTQPRANAGAGVLIENAPGNIIGGPNFGAGNVIAGNTGNGITITDDGIAFGATGNRVQGNDIGFNSRNALVYVIPNLANGVDISASGNLVGGDTALARNIIIGNGQNGVTIAAGPLGGVPSGNVVAGNFIGTEAGTDSSGNGLSGVFLAGAVGNTIGGTASAAANVIAGNHTGVVVSAGGSNVIAGNLIGVTADESSPLGNATDGIAVNNSPGNTIGGTAAGAGNTIGGNGGAGVDLEGAGTTGTLLWGNQIGTNAVGADSLGNDSDGVLIQSGAAGNTIGGTAAGQANTIAFNTGTGVAIRSGTGDTVLSNTIFANGQMGIVLVGAANHAQVAPSISSVTPTASSTVIAGTLLSTPATTFLIQIFANDAPDPAGTYEGQRLLGTTTLTTTAAGAGSFSLTLGSGLALGQVITATATSAFTGDSSAFATGAVNAPTVQFLAASFTALEPVSSALITVIRNSAFGSSTVVYTASPGTATPGVVFTPVTATLSFAPGQTSQTFSVPINSTLSQLGQFTVALSLSHPTGAALGSPAFATLVISAVPGSLELSTSTAVIPAFASVAIVTVERVGGASGTVGVSYATVGGTAIAGLDYTPISGTLIFPPGVTAQTVAIPFSGTGGSPSDGTVVFALGSPQGGASLGSPSVETVTIVKPLIITTEQLSANRSGIASISFFFNKPLDPARAQDLGNYGYFVIAAGRGGVFTGGGDFLALSSASYNPSNLSVTLTPSAPLRLGRLYRIQIDGQANVVLGNGITDTHGNVLAGSSGAPSTPFVTTFGAGSKLAYTDGAQNSVTLQLSRGGLVELFQAPSGLVQQLALAGTIPRKSTLTGTVHRGRGGTGRTTLPAIAGSAGVRIRLKSPPFLYPRATIARPARRAVASASTRIAAIDAAVPFARRPWHR